MQKKRKKLLTETVIVDYSCCESQGWLKMQVVKITDQNSRMWKCKTWNGNI